MKFGKKGFTVLLTVLIISAVALAGAGFWIYQTQIAGKKPVVVGEISQIKKPNENKSDTQTQPANNSNWQNYRNEALGVSFSYPEEWGNVFVEPNSNITDLGLFAAQYLPDKENFYYGLVAMQFDRNSAVKVSLYNDVVPGENYPNYGWSDFGKMKESRNVCDYKISAANTFKEYKLDECFDNCHNGIKTYITKKTQYFSPDINFGSQKGPGYVYSYTLAQMAYYKASNGYFDNLIIRYSPNFFSQIKEDKITVDDFFRGDFYPEKQDKQISKEEYSRQSEEFSVFVKSFSFFAPLKPAVEPFAIVAVEDQNITLIRQYYYNLELGNLDAAYGFLAKDAVKRSDFNSWYENVYKARPSDFQKLPDGSYRFAVDFQDENKAPEIYRINTKIDSGKISPILSEKIISPFVYYGGMYAFAKELKGKNYVALFNNGKETIIQEGPAEQSSKFILFRNVQFSPKGNYLAYDLIGWEYFSPVLYDIENGKEIKLDASYSKAGFTSEEDYYFYCGASAFAGTAAAAILDVPEFASNKDACVMCQLNSDYDSLLDCRYDENSKAIIFDLYSSGDTFDKKIPAKTVIFDTIKKKIIKEQNK